LTPSNPHFVEKGSLGISVRPGVLWLDNAYAGNFEKGEFFLIVSDPMYIEIMHGMSRWFYKVIFEERVYLVRVDDIVNPYYNGPAS
jgi:hypothetical protein